MADVLLTQLYDKEGNPLYPRINLKTVNGVPLYATGDPNDDDYNYEDNNIIISSSQAKVKIVYIYKANDTQPNIPDGGFISDTGVLTYPDGWSDEAQARREIEDDNTKKLWRSYATLTYGANVEESEWSVPSLINELNAGTDGMDGSDIKIVYCLTKENNAPTKPNGNGDAFEGSNNKGEWSDEPMGIDDTYKYEWVSMSIKEGGYNKSFSEFTTPTLWAKWGEDGTDGAGVEYVYLLTNSNEIPSINYDMDDESYQKQEYYPTTDEGVKWLDDYTAPTYNQRYSWVAIRHYKDGKWEKFSEPKLWNIYKVAGKAYADLYRRSDNQLSSNDLPNYVGSVYYLFENDKYYSSADKKNEILQVGEWFGDVPTEGGRYLYKTQAYVDIVDIDRVVEITKDKWSGPYFISLDGKDGENAIAESAYISINNDSFSLPITDLHKTFKGIEYKDTLSAKLMYGDDELDIKNYNISYNNNLFDYVDASISSDNKSLNVDIKIKNDVEFTKVEEIVITLTGDYDNKEYTTKRSFRIIPYISTIGEFFKIRINDDTVYVDPDGCVEKNGDIWKHTITIDLVDSKGNYIDPDSIGCKFVYEDKNEANVDINNGEINIKNCLNKEIENYKDVINLPNPLIIKLVDNEANTVREVEYIDFINMPQDGNNGEPGISNRMVFAYCSTDDYNAPATPIDGSVNFDTNEITYPNSSDGREWGPSQDLGGVVWLSTREFFSDGTSDLSWTKPMRITGDQGLPGEDGTKLEFAYHLCESENAFSRLESPSGDINYFPTSDNKDVSQWTDNPQGIDATYIIEACSQRTCVENGDWTKWSKPFIWSKWGEDGTDGDGVEYIFRVFTEKKDEYYPLSDDVYESDNIYVKNILQENDFVPNAEYVNGYVDANDIDDNNASILHNLFDKNWTDEPRDVGVNEPYEYVSIRRKKNGVWGSFSKATLWNEWHRDGYNTYTEFAFAAIPSNDTLVGYDVSGGTYKKPLDGLITYNILDPTKIKDVEWSDTLPEYDENKSIWMISAFFSEDENYDNNGKWTSPKKMTDSQTLQVEYCDSSINPADGITEMSDLVREFPELTLEQLEIKFRELEKEKRGITWGDENIVNPNWMATSRRVNGIWSNWVVTKIKGEQGIPGEKGDPGTSVQFKGKFDNLEQLQNAYAYYRTKEGDQPVPYFTDNNLSAGDGYIINGELWVYDGSGEDFSSAWINVGQIKGDKGDSVYLYIAYSNDGKTFTSSLKNDGILGTTPGKYIGICIKNIKVQNFPNDDNQFNEFTWSKWEGDDGFGVEQIFILNDTSIKELPTPDVEKEKWNAQDFKPTNWSDIPLTPTITQPYCLMAVRNYPPKNDDLDDNGYNLFKGDASNNAIVFSYLAKDGSGGLDGTSPFHIELSNSYDQVYVVDNVVEVDQEASTNVKVFKGSEDITNKVNISVSNDASYIDGVVKKVFSAGNKIDASTKELIYTITVDKDQSIGLDYPLQSVFKIVKLNGNIDYDLEVYPPYITVATNDDNKYSNDTINIKVTKSNISTTERNTTYVDKLPDGYLINYYIDGSMHTVTYNSSEGITLDSSTVKSIKNYIKIELKDGSRLIDNYTVENGKAYVTVNFGATVVEVK